MVSPKKIDMQITLYGLDRLCLCIYEDRQTDKQTHIFLLCSWGWIAGPSDAS